MHQLLVSGSTAQADAAVLERLFARAPGFVAMVHGPEHRYVYANRSYLDLVGERELIGRPVREALPELEGQGILERLDDVYRSGEAFITQATPICLARGGGELERRYVDFVYQPVFGADGAVEGIVGQGHDVTDRVRAEQALKDSEAHFRRTVEHLPQMTWIADADGNVIAPHPLWAERTGRPLAEAMRDGWRAALHPDDLPAVLRAFEEARAARAALDVSHRVRMADGSYRWIRAQASPWLDERGDIVRWYGVNTDIHDQVTAEQRLRESEARLRAIVDATPECVKIVAADGRLVQINPAGLRMVEAGSVCELGDVLELIAPEHRAQWCKNHARVIAGEPLVWEYDVIGLAGTRRHMETQAVPFRLPGGAPAHLAVTRDITQRKQVEQALRQSEEHYRHTVDLAPQIPFTLDPRGELLEISSRWVQLTGERSETALGHGWLTATHPEDSARVRSALQQSMAGGIPYDQRSRKRMADGTYRWFRVRAFPRSDEDGTIVCWYGYAEDIHEQVEAEQALQQSQAQLATIFDQAVVGIALGEAGKGVLLANERVCEILGRSKEELASISLADVTHPDDMTWNGPLFDESERSGAPYIIEKRYVRPDGTTVWCKVSVAFVARSERERPLTVTIIEDISQQRAAEAEVQQLQAKLMQVSHASAMGAMGMAIAHELNQPLASASNYTQAAMLMLRRDENADPKIVEALKKASEETLRAGEIIKRLRRLVAKGEAAVADVDLAKLIREAKVLALVGAPGAGIAYRLHLEPGIGVAADKVQLQQVFFNLVRNAVEAMQASERKELTVSTAWEGDEAVITIEDSGVGLSPEVRSNLFAPFVTTKSGGLGVGLSICKTIIEAHKGRIWAEPVPGGGTRFCFTLPLSRAAHSGGAI